MSALAQGDRGTAEGTGRERGPGRPRPRAGIASRDAADETAALLQQLRTDLRTALRRVSAAAERLAPALQALYGVHAASALAGLGRIASRNPGHAIALLRDAPQRLLPRPRPAFLAGGTGVRSAAVSAGEAYAHAVRALQVCVAGAERLVGRERGGAADLLSRSAGALSRLEACTDASAVLGMERGEPAPAVAPDAHQARVAERARGRREGRGR